LDSVSAIDPPGGVTRPRADPPAATRDGYCKCDSSALRTAAAREVAASLKASGDSLGHFPHRGRPVPGTAMRELVTTYPYIIRYHIDGNNVVILRVRHTSRRPTNP
jgi:plasmid stabilization system protein ParE